MEGMEGVTQQQEGQGAATQVANPPDPGIAGGTTEPSVTQEPQPEPTPIYRELGYENEDDLRNTHTRYKQQVSGSQAELQRLRQESSQKEEFYRQQMLVLQNQLLANQQALQPKEPELITLNQAMEAWSGGDGGNMMQQYDAQMRQLASRQTQGITPEQIQEAVQQQLQQATRPSHIAEQVGAVHPELRDPKNPVYARVYDEYDTYVSQNAGYLQATMSPDPAAIRNVPSPDGFGTKQVDLRIARELAWKVKADLAREAGRNEEFNRQNRPSVGASQRPAQTQQEPDAWGMFNQAEKDMMTQLSMTNSAPDNWPKDPKEMAKYRWNKMTPEEKHKRLSMAGR